nr:MAG TPA: hypothetical protein [Caudoviricetes sp.]
MSGEVFMVTITSLGLTAPGITDNINSLFFSNASL